MGIEVRAVWENGQLRLLDEIKLPEGQTLVVHIQPYAPIDQKLQAVLGRWVRFPDPTWDSTNPMDEAQIQAEIDRAIGDHVQASKAIIEDREDRF